MADDPAVLQPATLCSYGTFGFSYKFPVFTTVLEEIALLILE